MKEIIIKILTYLKGFVLVVRPHLFLGWLSNPFLMMSNTLSLTKWIAQQDQHNILNDFYTFKRDHTRRYQLYQYVIDTLSLNDEAFDYLEFGVCEGASIKWWVANTHNKGTQFFGFDTFEGLPENWGTFRKGDMTANIPVIYDKRVKFMKGLFQDTFPQFLSTYQLNNGKRKIIHLDADLFSSTLYTLTSLAPYFKKGDILFFDEFNVPNHEFFAFKCFCESYYIKTKLIGAVNNYYQVALLITE
ncbi:MAG: TylF/MycF/NovP-related O-methyltransferase [Bacteroidota bacterium]